MNYKHGGMGSKNVRHGPPPPTFLSLNLDFVIEKCHVPEVSGCGSFILHGI